MHNAFSTAYLTIILATALLLSSAVNTFAGDAKIENPYFAIQAVDRQTGRGVPLVELKTTNNLRYVTDSHGIVSFLEPGLMDREVFFHVESHGYEYPKDGFGYRGVRLQTTPGTTATIQIDRINIAERLYRVTGQGIYRDSVLTGRSVPLKHPVLNGQVVGQDSVFTCLYRGRIFWMWGDTARPSYPLGHFEMSGAVSDLPQRGGLDPAVGVDLEYYVDENGFSRPVAPLKEHGLVWLDALMTVTDPQGNERMVAKFARLASLSEVLERGLMIFNDATEIFEPIVRPGLEFLPYRNTGHAFAARVADEPYYYFTSPSPIGARLRVRAQWNDVIDANQYEVLTALGGEDGARWVKFRDVLASRTEGKAAVIDALEDEAKDVRVYDIESGEAIAPHNGTVYYNTYRQRWIGIFVQQFGDPSFLGEVWYAEADTPVGPWAYVRRIVTHNQYFFYNPKHHPLFDQDGGRTIYFEGTYSHTFSGSPEHATPRYDYNQIMYRLRLDDPRVALPAPVYRLSGDNDCQLGVGGDAANRAASVAFYAIEPNRGGDDLIPVYAQNGRLTAERPARSEAPLFFALSADDVTSENARIVGLYECRHTDSGQYRYDTDPQVEKAGWRRAEKPLCRVWEAPAGPLLLDRNTGPVSDR
ncbi:MAG: hypothetical protein JSW27_09120 [Phycisphaerales bacterium]|nr:MAG: hypothetical protein JSW27_09120 [Phycisphaerales bacterium]